MIFLWGIMNDDTISSVYDFLLQWHADVFFLNHAEIDCTEIQLSTSNNSYQLHCNNDLFNLNDATAAYLRPYNFMDYEKPKGDNEKRMFAVKATHVHHLMNTWAEFCEAKVINKPSAEATNHSKLYQSQIIQSSGFMIPDSLVSNDWESIREFASQYHSLIYKSMSSVRSIVKEISSTELKNRDDKIGPAFFQQKITGKNIRVHVVAENHFPCLIESDQIDYRYGPHSIAIIKIPNEISRRCIELTKKLGLLVSGIDLIVTSRNEWYCLEVNPNPGFSFYDTSEKKHIAKCVADLLMN